MKDTKENAINLILEGSYTENDLVRVGYSQVFETVNQIIVNLTRFNKIVLLYPLLSIFPFLCKESRATQFLRKVQK